VVGHGAVRSLVVRPVSPECWLFFGVEPWRSGGYQAHRSGEPRRVFRSEAKGSPTGSRPSQDGSEPPVQDIRPRAGAFRGALYRSGSMPRTGRLAILREYLD
jgi:hypothetical protein